MKPDAKKVPGAVIGGLIAAIVLDTVIQVAWKRAVTGIPPEASLTATVRAAAVSPFFYAAMAAFAAQFFNWLRVLQRADLSFAQPFTALSYITVLAISVYSLHEILTAAKLIGVGLILLGVVFISRTPHATADEAHRA